MNKRFKAVTYAHVNCIQERCDLFWLNYSWNCFLPSLPTVSAMALWF